MRRIRSGAGSEQQAMASSPLPATGSVTGSAADWIRARGLPAGLGTVVDAWTEDLDSTTRTGKCVRSALFDAVYGAAGGRDEEVRRSAGRALELLHEALLVHDDLADGDDHRRGAPNLQGRTTLRAASDGIPGAGAEHVGRVGGLLGGDLLLVAAMGEVARLPVPPRTLHRAIEEVERAVVASVAGEFVDVYGAADGRPATQERALAIAAAKTAAYSVTLPLVLGAVLAGAAEELIPPLRAVGLRLGTAYQVVDDVLGVFGDPDVTGKSVESDLVRRTPTVLLAHAADTALWPEIDEALDPDRPDPDTARRLLGECGAREHALGVAAGLIDDARTILRDPDVPAEVRDALDPHLDSALERTR